jgi:hypothetical protein
VVDRAREHPRELRGAHACLEGRDLRLRLGYHRLVLLGGPQIEQDLRVVEIARELLDGGYALLELGTLAGDRLRLLLVVPEPRDEGLLLEPVDLGFQPWKVKDAPLAP